MGKQYFCSDEVREFSALASRLRYWALEATRGPIKAESDGFHDGGTGSCRTAESKFLSIYFNELS